MCKSRVGGAGRRTGFLVVGLLLAAAAAVLLATGVVTGTLKPSQVSSQASRILKTIASSTKQLAAPKTSKTTSAKPKTPARNTQTPAPAPKETPKELPVCDFSRTGEANHKILFNEIAWAGDPNDANNEWIELKNNSGYDLRLNGWRMASEDEKIKIDFNSADVLPAGSYFLLERTDDDSAPNVPAGKIYSGALSNDGERLELFDASCALVDEIDAAKKWPAGGGAEKRTMERSSLDLSWHTGRVQGGTPRAENSAAFDKGVENVPAQSGSASQAPQENIPSPPAVQAKILISAIQITGGAGKTNNDFVKLYNTGTVNVDISGWQLKKRTQSGSESSFKTFPAGRFIPAGGYYMWANSENGFASSTNADVSSSGYLADNNSIGLFDKSGALVDAVAWGTGHANPFIEGTAYPDNALAGQTLHRKSNQDTDSNAEDFEAQ